MTDGVTIEIEGLKEIQRDLSRLAGPVQKKAASTATRAMAREMRDEIKSRAPVRTGRLRRNIRMRVRRARKWEGFHAAVGLLPSRTQKRTNRDENDFPFYGYVLEYGNSRIPARPWLRPAFAARGPTLVRVGSRIFRREIDKVWK